MALFPFMRACLVALGRPGPQGLGISLAGILLLGGSSAMAHLAHSPSALASGAAATSKGPLPLTVKDARVIAVPPGITETTLIVTLTNTSRTPVILSGVSSTVAGHAMLMKTVRNGQLTGMQTVPTLSIPARGTLKMNEIGDHIMLMNLKRPIKVGEWLTFTLKAKDGRTLTLKAIVKKP